MTPSAPSAVPAAPAKPSAAWLGLGLLAAAASLTAFGVWLRSDARPPLLGRLPAFTLVDQTGAAFGSDALKGRAWVADFVFTSCAGQCMALTGHMARLQRDLPESVALVSVSVDPARDTPAKLAAYARQSGAQDARWKFLTGEPEAVKALIMAGFKLPVAPGSDPKEPILHSSRFVLVDGRGRIRGYYDAWEEGALERLARDSSRL